MNCQAVHYMTLYSFHTSRCSLPSPGIDTPLFKLLQLVIFLRAYLITISPGA